jgi:DNA-binding NtrC family response regulator
MENDNELRIFLVDDDLFMLEKTKQQLFNAGHRNTRVFFTGSDFLDHLMEKPDVVFLDYNIGDITGFDILKMIKRFDPDIFVVMLSSQQSIRTAVESLKFGAFDYIIKGDNNDQIIENLMKRIADLRENLKRRMKSRTILF